MRLGLENQLKELMLFDYPTFAKLAITQREVDTVFMLLTFPEGLQVKGLSFEMGCDMVTARTSVESLVAKKYIYATKKKRIRGLFYICSEQTIKSAIKHGVMPATKKSMPPLKFGG